MVAEVEGLESLLWAGRRRRVRRKSGERRKRRSRCPLPRPYASLFARAVPAGTVPNVAIRISSALRAVDNDAAVCKRRAWLCSVPRLRCRVQIHMPRIKAAFLGVSHQDRQTETDENEQGQALRCTCIGSGGSWGPGPGACADAGPEAQAEREQRIAAEVAGYGDSRRVVEEEALATQLLPYGLMLRDIPVGPPSAPVPACCPLSDHQR